MAPLSWLAKQAKSRKKLAEAVARYANLRAAGGNYTDTIYTTDREGRPVAVFLRLDIVSAEQ